MGEEEVKNLMKDIGTQVRVDEVRILVGEREGKSTILLVKVRSEEEARGFGAEEEVERKGGKD